MNKNQGQSCIILLGEAGSAAGEKASLCAGQRGLTCQIHSWEEVQQFGTAALQGQRVLPLLLDAWLTPKTLQQVMKWAAGNSFCIMPVGDKDTWEKVVPLENSEWVGMEVYPPEGECHL